MTKVNIRLSDKRKKALAQVAPLLAKFGIKLPEELAGKINGQSHVKLTRSEIKRLEKRLSLSQRAYVTIDGPAKKFVVMSVESYINHVAGARKAARINNSKKEVENGRPHAHQG